MKYLDSGPNTMTYMDQGVHFRGVVTGVPTVTSIVLKQRMNLVGCYPIWLDPRSEKRQ